MNPFKYLTVLILGVLLLSIIAYAVVEPRVTLHLHHCHKDATEAAASPARLMAGLYGRLQNDPLAHPRAVWDAMVPTPGEIAEIATRDSWGRPLRPVDWMGRPFAPQADVDRAASSFLRRSPGWE